MNRIFHILLGLLFTTLSALPIIAQSVPATPQNVEVVPAPAVQLVQLLTDIGPIIIAIETERAPITAANFLRYVDQLRLDGSVFYRSMRIGDGGLIQGGARGDRVRVLRPIAHEPTTSTGLSHVNMTISMARGAPGTADGDFFIIVGDQMIGLDANSSAAGDNLGYAVFGRLVQGEEVVRAILFAPTNPTEGEGVMRGQMLSPAIRIITARRVARMPTNIESPRPILRQPDNGSEAAPTPRSQRS